MKHSRKMMLVDYDVEGHSNEVVKSGKMIDLNSPGVASMDSPQSELDREILRILNNRKLSDYEKARQYNELLRKYLLSSE